MAYALAGYTVVCDILVAGPNGYMARISAAYLKDELRIAFGDSAAKTVWDIMSQDNIVQRE